MCCGGPSGGSAGIAAVDSLGAERDHGKQDGHHPSSGGSRQCIASGEKPALFLSASAIGIYRNGEVHDEQSLQYDTHFAAEVTQAWEKASEGLDIHVRRVVFRIGLVLDAHSKLISLLWLPFRMGAGGPIGSGKQPFPFIHLNDLVRAMFWVLENRQAHGIYNLVAPERITNRDFARQFGALLHRPALLPVPAFFMRLLYGTAAVMVLESPAVHPARLMSEGFSFRYPSLQWALEEIVARKKRRGLHHLVIRPLPYKVKLNFLPEGYFSRSFSLANSSFSSAGRRFPNLA